MSEEEKHTLQVQVSKFKFNEFNKNNEDFRHYLQRFELEIYVSGLAGEEPEKLTAHCNLLLKSIGADTYKIIVDQFDPTSIFDISYKEIVTFLSQHFASTSSYLVVLTGVAAITCKGLSSLSNLHIIRFLENEKFSEFYGITKNEFENLMKSGKIAAKVCNQKNDAYAWYNGYDEKNHQILNTYVFCRQIY